MGPSRSYRWVGVEGCWRDFLTISLSPLKGGTDSSISPPQISSSREQETDKGPDPLDKGFPQFWDARAAQVAALFGNGYGGKAELEWQQLCTSHPPPPPSVPKSKVKQYVNRAAQRMLDAERLVTANDCEDYDTGVAIPCDAAGIPGLGGSSSPCALYTAQEVRARLWPPALADALAEFRGAR